jgi:hypothetical protein
MSGTEALVAMTSKVAGFGLVAKVGLGASLAAAGIAGAGTAGALPAPADRAVRDAIETVSPIELTGSGEATTEPFGEQVSADATAESDSDKGVDGRVIAADAPGADHRADPAAPADAPGQTGDTGLSRANDTPAAPHLPETPPSTTPERQRPAAPPVQTGRPNDPRSR